MAARKTATKSASVKTASNAGTESGDFLDALAALIEQFRDGTAPVETEADEAQQAPVAAKKGRKAKPAPEPEPEDDDDDADDADADDADAVDEGDGEGKFSEEELEAMNLRALKKLAKEYFEDDAVDGADKDSLIESLLTVTDDEEDEGDDDDADADDDDDSDDEDNDDEARDELLAMNLAALKKKARDEYGATAAEIRGLDKDGLIDLILDAEGEDDADTAVEDEDNDEDGYTEDELKEMSVDELKEICDEWEIEYTPRARAPKLVQAILDAQEEGE